MKWFVLSFSACVALVASTVPASAASPDPVVIVTHGAHACTPHWVGERQFPHMGYAAFALFNDSSSYEGSDVVCNFALTRDPRATRLVDAVPGFDLKLVLTSGWSDPQTVTCIASTYDTPGSLATTTRSVEVSPKQPVVLHFTAAELPASSWLAQASVMCRLAFRVSVGPIYLRPPRLAAQ
jgi:hypothetical protein